MDEIDNFLAHYGVKGQKWGVRRKVKRHTKRINRLDKKIKREEQFIKDYDTHIKLAKSEKTKGGRLDVKFFKEQKEVSEARIRLLNKGKKASEEVLKGHSKTAIRRSNVRDISDKQTIRDKSNRTANKVANGILLTTGVLTVVGPIVASKLRS